MIGKNVVVEWSTLMLRIREDTGLNLCLETRYILAEVLRGFLQSLETNAGMVP
jgi:hypothetical protein